MVIMYRLFFVFFFFEENVEQSNFFQIIVIFSLKIFTYNFIENRKPKLRKSIFICYYSDLKYTNSSRSYDS